jgi:hypothetical protein
MGFNIVANIYPPCIHEAGKSVLATKCEPQNTDFLACLIRFGDSFTKTFSLKSISSDGFTS